jgi:hypothetical protein
MTEALYVRVSPAMKRDIALTAEAQHMEITSWCRVAIEKALGLKVPKNCACGKNWGHTGRHSEVKY